MLPTVALGLACGLTACWTLAGAQDSKGTGRTGQASSDRQDNRKEDSSDESSRQADELLKGFQNYRERIGQTNEQTRKEVERTVKELTEVTELRFQMALALANLRARSVVAGSDAEAVNRELKAVLAQVRNELEQTRSQTEQIAAQLKGLREQLARMKEDRERGTAARNDSETKKPTQPVRGGGDPGGL
jgi:chromosome segregation ATPase